MPEKPTENPAPKVTVTVGVVLWPDEGDSQADPDVSAEEWRHFAAHYADVPLLELWRRLRRAEWNADHYQQESKQWQEIASKAPPLSVIETVKARHQRIRDLLAASGRISKPLLQAALAENDDTWNARKEAS